MWQILFRGVVASGLAQLHKASVRNRSAACLAKRIEMFHPRSGQLHKTLETVRFRINKLFCTFYSRPLKLSSAMGVF